MPFFCSACNLRFTDSLSAAAHKASIKHKKKSGELALEQQKYKPDADVTVADVEALFRRCAEDLGLKSWSELRFQETIP
ncbi:unnamed protein product [Phytomonas sp. EM1]|nr:unnamed protein product [Phytomonas sp. EM1]|eukprot:CCW61250.1 unnamed protein product [Phytomonas sp. isolate EM1]